MKRYLIFVLCLVITLSMGCNGNGDTTVKKGRFVVGEGIQAEDITDFYYTYENINYNAFYQRYRFYTEDGKHLFFHETRERKDDYGPAIEEDTTLTGIVELTEKQWSVFFDAISGGSVSKRSESAESGSRGPWLYLYWAGDESKYQEYTFPSYEAQKAFEELCVSLAADDADVVEESEDGADAEEEQADSQKEQSDSLAEDDVAATLLYQGHASIRIVTVEGKVIYIDPFMGEGYDLPADLILMTHGHFDHTKEELITERNEDCAVITWAEGLLGGTYRSYNLEFVTVEAVDAGYNKNHNVSECVGFVLTFPNGVKVYISGDTSTTPGMTGLAYEELDYAFICCDGVYNMDAEEASACAKVINAKHTIPYHTDPANSEGFDLEVAEKFDGPGKTILQPGEELVLHK